MKRISQFTIRINLTLSKIVGTIIVIGGLVIPDVSSSDRVFLVAIGAAAIGVKQYFISKTLNGNHQVEKEV